MAKTKNRIKKMNFQRTNRVSKLEPLSDNDKYIIEMAGYKKDLIGQANENLSRFTGGPSRPSYI
jgi:hypothetical protein|tara:strand:+ start:2719 stop:2910 length:192 start_codon:yes stop_codon:yes gene_type:complete